MQSTQRLRKCKIGNWQEEVAFELDKKAIEAVDESVQFADNSPFPDLDSLYDDVYVYNSDVPAWWTVDERSPEVHRGEQEREAGDIPHQLAEAGAAYANVGDQKARSRRQKGEDDEESNGADEEESGGDEESGEETEASAESAQGGGDSDEDESRSDESGDEVDEPGEGEGEGDDAGEGEVSGDEPEAEGGAD